MVPYQPVLTFWFEECTPEQWFKKDSAFDKEIKDEIAKGVIKPIDTLDLLLNVLSLNVFIFVSAPIYTDILGRTDKEKQAYIAHRKKLVVQIILNSLKS